MNTSIYSNAIISQFKAGIKMLRDVISKTPEALWNNEEQEENKRTWRLLYHTIWSLQFYLNPAPSDALFWKQAIPGAESLGGAWEDPSSKTIVEGVNTKEELLGFLDDIEKNLQQNVEALPLEDSSGFEWYPYSRLELHINTIRHLQHHTGQIIERLKANGINGFNWAIDGNPPAQW